MLMQKIKFGYKYKMIILGLWKIGNIIFLLDILLL